MMNLIRADFEIQKRKHAGSLLRKPNLEKER
jgi:hypothetical protein